MKTPPLRHFLHNLELYLGGASLLVILFLPYILASGDGRLLQASSVTTAIVAVLYGVILWCVRRRQKALRNEAIAEIQAMLQDLVRNKIALLMVDTYTATHDSQQRDESLERINQTIQNVLDILDSISEGSLQKWQSKYGDIVKLPHQ